VSHGFANLCSFGYFISPTSLHVVKITVNRDFMGNERMVTNTADISTNTVCLVTDGQPLRNSASVEPGPFPVSFQTLLSSAAVVKLLASS
jgi:hypothetical protein